MKNLPFYNVTGGRQVTTHSTLVLKIEGNFRGAVDSWIQVHDSATVPAEASVPIKSWPAAATSPFFQSFLAGELSISNGLYICVSTTEGTKTISAEAFDVFVELVEAEIAVTTLGDRTTAVTGRQLWSEASGPKKLVRLRVDGTGLAAKAYIQLFASDATPNGSVPFWSCPLSDNEIKDLSFGRDGLSPLRIEGSTLRQGATVQISSTPGVLTLIVGVTVTLEAEII